LGEAGLPASHRPKSSLDAVAFARSAAPRLAPTLQAGNCTSQPEQFISQLVSALPLYFRAYLIMNGKLTLGELIAFNMLSGRVAQPVLRLAQLWHDFCCTMSAARCDMRVYTFAGVVGPSGSGKSTFAELVQRLYIAQVGRAAFETGAVRAIHARDGQAVTAGEVLIKLDATIDAAERNRPAAELVVAELEVARLAARRRRSARRSCRRTAPTRARSSCSAARCSTTLRTIAPNSPATTGRCR
jgi:hypothetical protein